MAATSFVHRPWRTAGARHCTHFCTNLSTPLTHVNKNCLQDVSTFQHKRNLPVACVATHNHFNTQVINKLSKLHAGLVVAINHLLMEICYDESIGMERQTAFDFCFQICMFNGCNEELCSCALCCPSRAFSGRREYVLGFLKFFVQHTVHETNVECRWWAGQW